MSDPTGHLLIVDDNKVNRLLMSRSVELLGHRVSVAENGKIAMQMLHAEKFDMLLLDIEMPEMDGFQVLQALKDDARLRDLPVIVTSSVEGLDNIVRCIELGAEDYIPKPVNKTLLRARVNSGLVKKYLHDEQRKLLSRFATDEVARDLENSGFSMSGKRLIATVLFCDLRDFTAMSEHMAPEATIELLNTYYTLMFEAVTSNGGIVNQMIGDGLMSVFGAPKPIENSGYCAVLAAQEMLEMIDVLNEDRSAAGEPSLKIGIGIATGEVIAGYTGTNTRATYTCIGKTVNLAARLEAHTKVAGKSILMDQDTQRELGEEILCQPIAPVQFKGFTNPQRIYSI